LLLRKKSKDEFHEGSFEERRKEGLRGRARRKKAWINGKK
jgi:hypothetical protein